MNTQAQTFNVDTLIGKALNSNVMTVVIEKRHCENTTYDNCSDCGLARAIREQHPEIDLNHVGAAHIKVGQSNTRGYIDFDSAPETGWNSARFMQLIDGEISSYTLEINLDQ